ncbi:hypothetical protein TYRP_015094 [Tyrophagus putrescentiae]|nr:hypothetical protein TYRP_015094 [Tyrophagus putrescentiae]
MMVVLVLVLVLVLMLVVAVKVQWLCHFSALYECKVTITAPASRTLSASTSIVCSRMKLSGKGSEGSTAPVTPFFRWLLCRFSRCALTAHRWAKVIPQPLKVQLYGFRPEWVRSW